MLTKGAIGNLINRYRAVLKKCNLINTFGSLAVASMLVLGGAGVAKADLSNVDFDDIVYRPISLNSEAGSVQPITEALLSRVFTDRGEIIFKLTTGIDSFNDIYDFPVLKAALERVGMCDFAATDNNYKLPNKDVRYQRIIIGGKYAGVGGDNVASVNSVSVKMNPNTMIHGEFNMGGVAIGSSVFDPANDKLTINGYYENGNYYSTHVEKANLVINGGTLLPIDGDFLQDGHTRIRAGGVSHNNAKSSVGTSTITIKGAGNFEKSNSVPNLPYTMIMGGGCNGGYETSIFNENSSGEPTTGYDFTKVGYYYEPYTTTDNGNSVTKTRKVWYNTTDVANINIEQMAGGKNILDLMGAGTDLSVKEMGWFGSVIFAGGDNAYVGTSNINITDSTVGTVFAGGECAGVTGEVNLTLSNSGIVDFYSGGKGWNQKIDSKDVGEAHKVEHEHTVGNVTVTMKKNSAIGTWVSQIFNDNYTDLKTWTGPVSNEDALAAPATCGISFVSDGTENRIYLKDNNISQIQANAFQGVFDTSDKVDGSIEIIRTCRDENVASAISTNYSMGTGKLAQGAAGSLTVDGSNSTDPINIHFTGTPEMNETTLNPDQYAKENGNTNNFYNEGFKQQELLTDANGVPVDITVVDKANVYIGDQSTYGGGTVSGTITLQKNSTLGIEGGDFTLKEVDANPNSVITVGTSSGAADLTLGADSDLNGALVLIDPAWKGSPDLDVIKNASHVYKEVMPIGDDRRRIDGRYAVVQNSVLTLGKKLSQDPDGKDWATKEFSDEKGVIQKLGIRWGEDDATDDNKEITAAVALLNRFGLKKDGGKFVGALYIDGSKTDAVLNDPTFKITPGSVTFAGKSLLMMPATLCEDGKIALNTVKTLNVASTSKVYIAGAVDGGEYKIVEVGGQDKSDVNIADDGWDGENILLALDLQGEREIIADSNGGHLVVINVSKADLDKVLPGLLIPNVVAARGNDTSHAGSAFLENVLSGSAVGQSDVVPLINESARPSVVAGVQNTALRIADAASNTVLDHMSLAANTASVHADGVDFWAAPMYGNLYNSGMVTAGNSVRGQFGGLALGADVEAANVLGGKFRLGAAINGGGGQSETKGGATSTQNDYDFGGFNLYAGWNKGAFNAMASVGYAFGNHDVEMGLPSALGLGNAKADIDTSAITADLRAEYQLKTDWVDVLPHVGVRYTALRTDSHDLKVNGSVLNSLEADTQHIVQFPVGVTLSKDFSFADWTVKPSADISFIPAVGDKDMSSKVRFSGVDAVDSFDARVMDSSSWAATLGVQAEKGKLTFGLNYGVQASSHETDQNVQVKLGWKF